MKTLLLVAALLSFGSLAHATDAVIANPNLIVIPNPLSEKANTQEDCLTDKIKNLYAAGAFGQFSLFSATVSGPFRGDQAVTNGGDPSTALYLGSVNLVNSDGFSENFMYSITLQTPQKETWEKVQDTQGNLGLKASQVLTSATFINRKDGKAYPINLASCAENFKP